MKKKLTAAAVIAVLFVVLLLVYRLVVVPMMNAADEPEETTAVSLVPGEVEGVRGRIQMFDQVTSDKVQSLYVHNSYGTYELVRKDSSLVLKGHENLLLNAEKLAQAVVNAGLTLNFTDEKEKDPATGKPHQLRRLSNGDFHPADAQKVANGVQHFLTMLRAKNPGAKLVWCIGMLGSELLPVLRQGMEQYKTITGDSSVYLLELPNTTPETVGARQHPGAENHRQAAKVLTAFLRTIL